MRVRDKSRSEEAAKLYLNYLSITEVSEKIGVHQITVKRWLDFKGIKIRTPKERIANAVSRKRLIPWNLGKKMEEKYKSKRIDIENKAIEIISLYSKGSTSYEIAEKFHCSRSLITKILKENNVTLRKSGNRPGQYSKIWRKLNPKWNGGISLDRKRYETFEYKKWRFAVLERDKRCMMCSYSKELEAHHIIPWRFSTKKQKVDIENGISLCKNCHKSIGRKEHEFVELLKERLERS